MAQRTASRERVVCDHCDLPYYTDRTGCPYCEMAGLGSGSADKSDVVEEARADTPSSASGDSEREGLLGRLKQALGI